VDAAAGREDNSLPAAVVQAEAKAPPSLEQFRALQDRPGDPDWSKITSVTDPVFTAAARIQAWRMLHAVTVKSAVLGARKPLRDPDAEAAEIASFEADCDRMFGAGNWLVRGGRIFWLEADLAARSIAVREILARDEPTLHKMDARVTGTYNVKRYDPNQEPIEEGEIVDTTLRAAPEQAGG